MFDEVLMNNIKDPYNSDYNYNLGKEYENINQYSSALTYFLRTIDFTSNRELAYDALISAAKCLIELGDRFNVAKRLLEEAFNLNKERIEAVYFLCLIYKYLDAEDEFLNLHPKFLEMKDKNLYDLLYENLLDLGTVGKIDIQKKNEIRSSNDQEFKDFKHENSKIYSNIVLNSEKKKNQLYDLYNAVKKYKFITDTTGSYDFLVTLFRLNSLIKIKVENAKSFEYINYSRLAVEKRKNVEFIFPNEKIETDALIFSAYNSDIGEVLSLASHEINKCIIIDTTHITHFKDLYTLINNIEKFTDENIEWKLKEVSKDNNDLIVIEKD